MVWCANSISKEVIFVAKMDVRNVGDALFHSPVAGYACWDKTTGLIHQAAGKQGKRIIDEYIAKGAEEAPQMPLYSVAYIRQILFRAYWPDAAERARLCQKYGIDDTHDFEFLIKEPSVTQEKEECNYCNCMHRLFEDSHIEDYYRDFFEFVRNALGVLWCLEKHMEYEPLD